LPVIVNNGVKLHARADFGDIIYIKPQAQGGRVTSLKLGQDINLEDYDGKTAVFKFKGRKFEIRYN